MSDRKRQLHLNVQATFPGHPAAWRTEQGRRGAGEDIAHFQAVSRAAERALLEPRRHDLTAPGLLGATPVLGSLYILGDSVDAERDCVQIAQRADGLSGLKIDLGTAVLPNGCGMLVRALGATASQVHAALLGIWGGMRG